MEDGPFEYPGPAGTRAPEPSEQTHFYRLRVLLFNQFVPASPKHKAVSKKTPPLPKPETK